MAENEEIEVSEANTTLREGGIFKNLTTTISLEDHTYCKNHGLKFNVLLAERIAQIKAVESGAIVSNVEREREKRERFQDMFENARQFIEEKGLIGEFWDKQK